MSREVIFENQNVTESNRTLHTPGEFTRQHLLFVQEVGTLRSITPHVSRREELDSLLYFIVTDGEGTVRTDDQEYKVKSGDCVFLDCSKNYEHISSLENPWTLIWVHFHGHIAKDLYQLFAEKNNGSVVFRPGNEERTVQLLQNLMMLGAEYELIDELKASYLLMNLITNAIEDVTEGVQMEDVREFIGENYSTEGLIDVIVQQFGMVEAELKEQFKNSYGIDIMDYILNRRFTAAKELLRFTIKDIDTVIKESGIRNEYLFRQLFHDKEGMTAEEYRKKWAQWIKD